MIRGGYGKYYDEIFQNITLYEKWSDPNTPLNFVTLSPSPFTPTQFAANRESIRQSFTDPTFAGQLTRITAPDLVQPYAHHTNVGFSVSPAKSLAFDVDYVHAEGQAGDCTLADQQRCQREHPYLPGGSLRSEPRSSAYRGQPRSLEVRRRLRRRQVPQGQGPDPGDLRLDEGARTARTTSSRNRAT